MKRIFTLVAMLPLSVFGANYYVDFDGGSDAANGTATSTPWKHCPGDANATGTASSATLAAGDFVNFKGGVVYRGLVPLNTSGTIGSPITFQSANGFGSGQAIIAGADLLSQSWALCTNAGDCWNNANWPQIWHTTIPANFNIWNCLYQDTAMVHLAQYPVPPDFFNWDDVTGWKLADSIITRSNLVSANALVDSSSSYYLGAWAGIWTQGNRVALQSITNYVPATHTIGFALFASSLDPYQDPTMAYFTLLNHPALITAAGQYAIRTNENRIYFWPIGSANPNNVTMSTAARKYCLHGNQDYLTFNNLTLCDTYADPQADWETEAGGCINVGTFPSGRNGIVVTNCVLRDLSSPETGGHAIYIYSGGRASITGNSLSNSISRGIIINGGTNSVIASNYISHIDGTTIEIWFSTNTLVLANTIEYNTGTHANALTAYDGNFGVAFKKNKVTHSVRMLTFQNHTNFEASNNIFDGNNLGAVHEFSSTMGGYVRWLNNTIIRPPQDGTPILYLNSSSATYVIQNNIIDGTTFTGAGHTYNIYTCTNSNYVPTLGTGETLNTNLAAILPSLAGGIYIPTVTVASGYPRNAGTDESSLGLVDDYLGFTRPQEGAYDIGPYEYQSPSAVLGGAGSGGGGTFGSWRTQ